MDEIARLLNAELHGNAALDVTGAAALDRAGPNQLTFAEGARARAQAADSRAGCILVPEGTEVRGKTTIAVANPKLAFIRAVEALRPPAPPPPGVHPTAVVAPDALLAASASVGPGVVIEARVTVGARTRLSAGVTLGEGAEVGADCVLYPRVTVYPGARIGNRVVLHAGVVIGSDGFGYVFAEGRHHKFPQLGEVIIEDDVEIGSNSTVDRGSLGATVIGQGAKIDNLCQIAHNVRIGRHTVIAGQSGIAGSAEVGSYVVIGGQVGVSDHTRIEDRVMIGAKSAIFPGKIVRQGAVVEGIPARPVADFKRQQASLARLPDLTRQVRSLAKKRKVR
ncbi:MAG TPA: UDP-3-O-(3-hydroxymyristoyl)glucosamine N-acyltransferase [Candidatus Sulfopaludibacter sp.]|nr:UDP-3-O-(3-hydroxymyristoyl)glucosamine N-acyltransferase [Candidatus Sulfopaludibacter sp.]